MKFWHYRGELMGNKYEEVEILEDAFMSPEKKVNQLEKYIEQMKDEIKQLKKISKQKEKLEKLEREKKKIISKNLKSHKKHRK
jgi:TolA-binding protein